MHDDFNINAKLFYHDLPDRGYYKITNTGARNFGTRNSGGRTEHNAIAEQQNKSATTEQQSNTKNM